MMTDPVKMARLQMRLTDQMEKDGKRIRELEARIAELESKLVQAGEGFPS